jgi:hypothetical protein
MKKAALIWLGSAVAAVALLATAGWSDVPEREDPGTPSEGGPSLAAISQQFSPTLGGARSGVANVTINGITYPVTIESQPLELAEGPDNFGRLVGIGGSVIDFGDGNTLITADEVRFTPTQPGWFQIAATMTITGGTGIFAQANGVLDAAGIAHLEGDGVVSEWLIEGTFSV